MQHVWQPTPEVGVDARPQYQRDIDGFLNADKTDFAEDADMGNFLNAVSTGFIEAGIPKSETFMLGHFIIGLFYYTQQGIVSKNKILKTTAPLEISFLDNAQFSVANIKDTYRLIRTTFQGLDLDIGSIFKALSSVFTPAVSLRIRLLVSQSKGAGTAALNIVLDTIRMYPHHPVWSYLIHVAPAEAKCFIDAARTLAGNPLATFDSRNHQNCLKGTLYPSFVVAAKYVQIETAKNRDMRHYGGKFVSIPDTQILAIIAHYTNHVKRDIDTRIYMEGGQEHVNWDTIFPDLGFVGDKLTVTNLD